MVFNQNETKQEHFQILCWHGKIHVSVRQTSAKSSNLWHMKVHLQVDGPPCMIRSWEFPTGCLVEGWGVSGWKPKVFMVQTRRGGMAGVDAPRTKRGTGWSKCRTAGAVWRPAGGLCSMLRVINLPLAHLHSLTAIAAQKRGISTHSTFLTYCNYYHVIP